MKLFSLTLFILQLSFVRHIIAPATAAPAKWGDIRDGDIGNYSQYIDANAFEKIIRLIQAQLLPKLSLVQINAVIEPIRQNFYHQVPSQTAHGLNSDSYGKAGCSDTSCLSFSQVQSLILDIVKSSLHGALATINGEVSALENTVHSTLSSAIAALPLAPPQKPTAAKNPTPPTPPPQTPGATESNGSPTFVSTIPAKAPGAPKLTRRKPGAEPVPMNAATAHASGCVGGRPHAVSFIPKSHMRRSTTGPPNAPDGSKHHGDADEEEGIPSRLAQTHSRDSPFLKPIESNEGHREVGDAIRLEVTEEIETHPRDAHRPHNDHHLHDDHDEKDHAAALH